KRSKLNWSELAKVETLVILMGVRAISQIAKELISAGVDSSTTMAVIERGTTEEQKTFLCTLGEALKGEVGGQLNSPSVIVIGKVTALAKEFGWYHMNSLQVSPFFQGKTGLEHKG
ncbi:MAG: SAM-dependent methyltransferase, partial [Nitrososphaerales archaeon]